MPEHKIFELGDFPLQKGSVLPDAKLGYATLGELNAARDNVILCPTWFTATPSDVAFVMTGSGERRASSHDGATAPAQRRSAAARAKGPSRASRSMRMREASISSFQWRRKARWRLR